MKNNVTNVMKVVKGAVERSMQVVEFLAREARWMRMSDISTEVELQNGQTRRVPAQLCRQGWAEQDNHTFRHRLTLKLSLLGERDLHGLGLPGPVQPILDAVAAQCREPVRLIQVPPERYDGFHALLKEAASRLGAIWPLQSVAANSSEAV